MKKPLAVILLAALAAPGCSPGDSQPTFAAAASPVETAAAQPGAPLTFGDGPTVGSTAETRSALDGGAPYLETLADETYPAGELAQAGETYTYTITLDTRRVAVWQTNWCATTEEALLQNLEHIRVEFTVNGARVGPDNILTFRPRIDSYYCAAFAAVVYDWPEGKTVLEINVAFDDDINDGAADYAKGAHTYRYEVTGATAPLPTLNPPGGGPTG